MRSAAVAWLKVPAIFRPPPLQEAAIGATIFVAWEHVYEAKAVVNLVKQLGGDSTKVPAWPGADFDSLYVVKIVRIAGQPPAVSFTHDHEGLDHLSKNMPVPASNAGH